MEFLFMVQNRQSWILDSCQHCLFLTFYAEEAVCKCSPVGILVGDEHSYCKLLQLLLANLGK